MTFFAFAGKCGGFGASGLRSCRRGAARPRRPAARPSAIEPTPTAQRLKKCRRVMSRSSVFGIHGVHSRVMVSSRFSSTRAAVSESSFLRTASSSAEGGARCSGGRRLRGRPVWMIFSSAVGELEERRVVQQRQRLQRRVAADAAGAGAEAVGRVEDVQRRVAAWRDRRTCRGRGGSGPRPCSRSSRASTWP